MFTMWKGKTCIPLFMLCASLIPALAKRPPIGSPVSARDLVRAMRNYNYEVAPNASKPTTVEIEVFVARMKFLPQEQTLKLTVVIDQHWQDPRFQKMFVNQSSSSFFKTTDRAGRIWTPNLVVTSSHSNEKEIREEMIKINSTAHVVYSVKFYLEVDCRVDSDEEQYAICPLVIQSYGRSTKEVDLQWIHNRPFVTMSSYIQSTHFGDYVTSGLSQTSCDIRMIPGQFPCQRLLIVLVHDSVTTAFHGGIYVMSAFLVLISWLGFWIQPSEKRIFLGVGVSLVLSILYLTVAEWAENTHMYYTSTAQIWITFCICLVILMVFEYALVYMCMGTICTRLTAIRTRASSYESKENPRSRCGDISDAICGLIIFPAIFILGIIGFTSATYLG